MRYQLILLHSESNIAKMFLILLMWLIPLPPRKVRRRWLQVLARAEPRGAEVPQRAGAVRLTPGVTKSFSRPESLQPACPPLLLRNKHHQTTSLGYFFMRSERISNFGVHELTDVVQACTASCTTWNC